MEGLVSETVDPRTENLDVILWLIVVVVVVVIILKSNTTNNIDNNDSGSSSSSSSGSGFPGFDSVRFLPSRCGIPMPTVSFSETQARIFLVCGSLVRGYV